MGAIKNAQAGRPVLPTVPTLNRNYFISLYSFHSPSLPLLLCLSFGSCSIILSSSFPLSLTPFPLLLSPLFLGFFSSPYSFNRYILLSPFLHLSLTNRSRLIRRNFTLSSMAKQCTASDDFPIMSPKPLSLTVGSSSSSGALVDDDIEEDACSICLDPFSHVDPATVTCCKHEYHLHCILEWSRRSKECPICWQSLVLKDPVSQELLAAAQVERSSRARCPPTQTSSYSQLYSQHDLELEPTDGFDFHEHVMQHIATAMSRARYAHRSDRRRYSEAGSSHAPSFNKRHSADGFTSNISPTSSISSEIDGQHQFFPVSSIARSDAPDIFRTLQNQLKQDETQRPRSTELLALSDSIKSRLSAASNRCKDSISKGKQGFREKFLAHNDSVKELSKGVQREMSSSIAGLAKMMERLDLKSKRNGNSRQDFSSSGGASNAFSKGKGVQQDAIAACPDEKRVEVMQNLCLDESSSVTCSIPSPDIVSHPRRSRN